MGHIALGTFITFLLIALYWVGSRFFGCFERGNKMNLLKEEFERDRCRGRGEGVRLFKGD